MIFKDLLGELDQSMYSKYTSVRQGINPVDRDFLSWNNNSQIFVVAQYGFFSKIITKFLLDAYLVTVNAGWKAVSEELVQNISEELDIVEGDECHSESALPHYVLLRQGIQEALGIDIAEASPGAATRRFINDTLEAVNDLRAPYVSGCVFALENSATPELQMVSGWVETVHERAKVAVSRKVQHFFHSHISEIEILHQERLKTACANYVKTQEQGALFKEGFERVMAIMDCWWEGLAQEALAS